MFASISYSVLVQAYSDSACIACNNFEVLLTVSCSEMCSAGQVLVSLKVLHHDKQKNNINKTKQKEGTKKEKKERQGQKGSKMNTDYIFVCASATNRHRIHCLV